MKKLSTALLLSAVIIVSAVGIVNASAAKLDDKAPASVTATPDNNVSVATKAAEVGVKRIDVPFRH